jgi:phosphotransferase system enzyme I (PtsI)
MGLRSFSMSPALIPTIKDLAAHVSIDQAKQIVAETLEQRTTAKVQSLLTKRLHALAPALEALESAD